MNILSYNIAGLKSKVLFPGFFDFIHKYDVFFLFETHVMEGDIEKYQNFFIDYELYWISAVRSAAFGRAKGGSVYGLKKESRHGNLVTFKLVNNYVVVSINMNSPTFLLIPTYLNCNHWAEDFETLNECIENVHTDSFMILGDLNARVGELQEILPEFGIRNYNFTSSRKSRDKTVNSRGRRFVELCEERALIILNGRTPGDFDGEYTYISTVGTSTIDIVAATYNLSSYIKNLEICNQPYSDHLPVSLRCLLNIKDNSAQLGTEMRLLPKLDWKKQNVNMYKSKLEFATNALPQEMDVNDLINIVIESSIKTMGTKRIFKKKWFDGACFKARKKAFKWLNIFRKQNNDFSKHMYLRENNNFKELCKVKKIAYYEEISANLDTVRDSKQFWSIVKELRGGTFTRGCDITVEDFRCYFENLLNPPMIASSVLYAAPYIQNPLLDSEITINELLAVLKKAKDNKAPGPDRVPYEFFKNAPMTFLSKLAKVFNNIYESESLPDSFSNSIVFPIYKKGDPNHPGNYRGLSFMDAIVKLLTAIANNRLTLWEQDNNVLNECQSGFRPGYSTTDNIFSLCSIVKIKLAKRRGKIHAFFVDFKAAFDTIDRAALFYKLYQLGVSTKFIRFLQRIYKNTSAQVWNGDKLSEKFWTNTGLRQGCSLSPLLFSFFINDIEENMEGGVNIDGLVIKALLYADDLVLLAEDPSGLQKMINKLEEYCQIWNLEVNLNKSKIMTFKKGGGRRAHNENWTYQGNNIEIVKEIKYLGITLTPKLTMKAHLKNRLSAAKGVLNSTWSRFIRSVKINHSSKIKIYTATSRSVLCYGAQVWGFTEYEDVEKLQRFFIKKLLQLPQKTPNYVLTLETGLSNVYLFTLKCHFDYMLKVLGSYTENRLPHILALKAIQHKLYWYEEWSNLADKHDEQIESTLQNVPNLASVLFSILEKEERWHWVKAEDRARQTVRHGLYDKLIYNLGESNYFRDDYSIMKIRLILMYRSGMLKLNASPWRTEGMSVCSLCNLEEDEDLMHYLAVCPILKEFRLLAFGKQILTENEVVTILNGGDFDALSQYAKLAWKYRQMLIEEFN